MRRGSEVAPPLISPQTAQGRQLLEALPAAIMDAQRGIHALQQPAWADKVPAPEQSEPRALHGCG